jgi:hypothetical protein
MRKKLFKRCGITLVTAAMACSLAGCTSVAEKMDEINNKEVTSENVVTTEDTETKDNSNSEVKSEKSEETEKKTETDTTAEPDTTEEITTDSEAATEAAISLESGGDTAKIEASEWKSAYKDRIQEIIDEHSYIYGYLYDVDGNGIPELFISDSNLPQGETYTYTQDGMVSLGSIAGAFSHLYYKDGCLIRQASSGGSPGPIWVSVLKFNGTDVQTVNELEFGEKLGSDGKPEVTGAGSYDEAVSIAEGYGMSVSFTEMEFDGETYCQVEVDTSGLEGLMSYENDDFIAAVENY